MNDPTRILIVDADDAHTAALASTATSSGVRVVGASASSVEDVLGRSRFDAVVIDLDGDPDEIANVVGEVERHADGVTVIGVCRRVDESRVATAAHLGAVAILVKPVAMPVLVEAVRTPAPDAGYSGSCVGVSTAQLLSLHCAAGHDGALYLHTAAAGNRAERTGAVYFESGQPVHATAGQLVGADAIRTMLAWHDAEATWVAGAMRSARTIVGRWQGMFVPAVRDANQSPELDRMVALAHPAVVEKLARLAQTPDVLGAFLLRHAEVVTGRCVPALDEPLAARALCRLAHVFFDVEAQPDSGTDGEIQAVIGDLRLVLDRIGPPEAGFQVGVVVRQAAPICKSLRRLLRQIDSSFTRAEATQQRTANQGVRANVSAVA
jgi:CheY-like chemotaxis protein